MIELGIVLVVAGGALAGWALWKVSEAAVEGPAEQLAPYVYPFAVGMAIAIVGGFILLGQSIWRFLL